jgi:hypothetical protein
MFAAPPRQFFQASKSSEKLRPRFHWWGQPSETCHDESLQSEKTLPTARRRSAATARTGVPCTQESCKVRGTGLFFGQKSHIAGKGSAENMDLSPSRQDLQFSWRLIDVNWRRDLE